MYLHVYITLNYDLPINAEFTLPEYIMNFLTCKASLLLKKMNMQTLLGIKCSITFHIIFNTDDEEEIIKMYQTVLHHITGWTCAKTTYLFYKIHGENTLVKKTNIPMSQGNKHAEKLMIEDFRQKICKNKIFFSLRHITVYLNNSPCSSITHNCTNNLRNFLKDYEDVKLKIYVTSLYNIRRKSCDKEKNKHNRFIDVEDHFANSTGLWNLMQHDRCEVKAYSKEIWEKLLKELKLSNSDEHDLLKTYTDKRN